MWRPFFDYPAGRAARHRGSAITAEKYIVHCTGDPEMRFLRSVWVAGGVGGARGRPSNIYIGMLIHVAADFELPSRPCRGVPGGATMAANYIVRCIGDPEMRFLRSAWVARGVGGARGRPSNTFIGMLIHVAAVF